MSASTNSATTTRRAMRAFEVRAGAERLVVAMRSHDYMRSDCPGGGAMLIGESQCGFVNYGCKAREQPGCAAKAGGRPAIDLAADGARGGVDFSRPLAARGTEPHRATRHHSACISRHP